MTFVSVCRSKHEEIDLVSVEEFYEEAPPDISKAEITRGDPHQQTLARLDWELEQRKRWLSSSLTLLTCADTAFNHRDSTLL